MKSLIYYGDPIKALDENGKVGGYLVRFSDPTNPRRDLQGEYFTSKTYLGAHQGNGVDTLFNHGQALELPSSVPATIRKEIAALPDRVFAPVKTSRDAIGIFAETILRLADEYEAAVFGLVRAGKLGWSSGSMSHLVRVSSGGEITRWPIGEASLTHQPAEPLNKVTTLDSMRASAARAEPREIEEIRARNEATRAWLEREQKAWLARLKLKYGYYETPRPGTPEARRFVESAMLRSRHILRELGLD